jgi:hypothetical protein
MIITLYTVTYLNDDVADDFGCRIFTTEAAAEAWADEYLAQNDPDSDGTEGTDYHVVIDTHTVEV